MIKSADGFSPTSCESLPSQTYVHRRCDDTVVWPAPIQYVSFSRALHPPDDWLTQSDHTFRWFVLAMLLNPSVQEKCHAELYRVVGRSRLPRFGDWERLSYIRATLREVVRWRPVAVLGKDC